MTTTARAGRLLAAALILAPFMSTASAQETLVAPAPDLQRLLLQKLNGTTPDFRSLARGTDAVRNADEFDRSDVARAEELRLQEVWSALDEVERLVFRVETRIGEYDGDRGGFPIELFAPSASIATAVPILFGNAGDARIFPMTPDEGRALRAEHGSLSGFKIVETFRVTDIMALAEATGVRYDDAAALEPFDPAVIAAIDEVSLPVAAGQVPADARLFYAGDLEQSGTPLHDLRAGYRESYRAPTMLWVIDRGLDGTSYVSRSSLP